MSRRGPGTLASLETLFETRRGKLLPLPPRLARLYGGLRMPLPRARPHVFSNFVTTLDGVVSLQIKGHASGGDISGSSAQDRMVMGLLRAVADVVIVGAGTLGVDRRHVWTAEAIFPALADDYLQLAQALCKPGTPLNVIVSGSGEIDLRLPVFTSGKVRALIVTTVAGAKRLCRQTVPDSVQIHAIRPSAGASPRGAGASPRGAGASPSGKGALSARAVLDAVCRASPGRLILIEGGPRLLGDFYAEQLIDEQFLTLAPQIAGRDAGDGRLSLVMGKAFAPRHPLWGNLTDLRRGGSHLFLRYSFPASRPGPGIRANKAIPFAASPRQ